MSTLPVIKPQNFWPDVSKEVGPNTQFAVKIMQDAIQQHDQAFASVKTQIDAITTGTTPIATATTPTTTPTPPPPPPLTLGQVNVQTGTTYTLQGSDYGGIVVLNNAAAVAVSANSLVQPSWFGALENLGVGLVTITPTSGTINNEASISLSTDVGAWLFFDGTNWWAETGTGVMLETNGTPNSTQGLLNLVAGDNIMLTEAGGSVTVASTGGGSVTVAQNDVTAERSFATEFVAATDIFVTVTGQVVAGPGDSQISASSGATGPEQIEVASTTTTSTITGATVSVSFMVPLGYTYSVVYLALSGTPDLGLKKWIEWTL